MTMADAAITTLRRAGVATLSAEGLFGALCVVATHDNAARVTSPWGADLDDAVVTCTILVMPLLAVPTAVRLLAHRGAPVPPAAARAVLAGSLTGLGIMAAALLACADALAGRPGGLSPLSGALLVSTAGAGVLATALALRANEEWRPALARLNRAPTAAGPDFADELATLVASVLPGSFLARAAAWLDRGLDVWRVSPRRHPWAAVVAIAWATGLLVAQWHAVREGPWSGVRPALVFAGTVAVMIGCGLAAGVAWLGLLRPAARPGSRREA